MNRYFITLSFDYLYSFKLPPLNNFRFITPYWANFGLIRDTVRKRARSGMNATSVVYPINTPEMNLESATSLSNIHQKHFPTVFVFLWSSIWAVRHFGPSFQNFIPNALLGTSILLFDLTKHSSYRKTEVHTVMDALNGKVFCDKKLFNHPHMYLTSVFVRNSFLGDCFMVYYLYCFSFISQWWMLL